MPAALMVCALALPPHALASEGRSRIHATIGQPLSIQVPLEFSGSRSGGIEVSVEPIPGMPDPELDVAETVVATYDRQNSQVHLTTPGRVTVPALRLHLSVVGERLSIAQDIDVLVDLPDFSRHFDRPVGEQAAESGGVAANGIKVLEVSHPGPQAPVYGDSAAFDSTASSAERPVATPPKPPVAAALPTPAPPAPERISKKHPHLQSPATAEQPVVREAAAQPGIEQASVGNAKGGWLDALKVHLPSPTISAKGLSPLMSVESYRRAGKVLAAAALALVVLLAARRLYRLWPLRFALPRPATDRKDRWPAPQPEAETGELARLRRMLDANPLRSDIRYQFVQRLYKARDAVSFAEVALPLRGVANDEIWRRVSSMADELLPGDARFVREATPEQAGARR